MEIVHIIIVHRDLEPPMLGVGVCLRLPFQFELSWSWFKLQGRRGDTVGGSGGLVLRSLSHRDVLLGLGIVEQREL